MKVKNTYLSAPSTILGKQKIDNQMIINRVKQNFKGTDEEWRRIQTGIRYVFRACGTQTRYLGKAPNKTLADHAVMAAQDCLEKHQLAPHEIDVVIYGGIIREYLEPATAMEIAAKLGIERASIFDVTSACVGLLQAVYTAVSLLQSNEHLQTALCCAADFSTDNQSSFSYLNYNIQSFEELSTKVAGLTIGNAASAWLISKKPLQQPCAELLYLQNTSLPATYTACQLPINGTFVSDNKEVFDLGLAHVPNEIERLLKTLNWKISDVAYFLSHQPSKKIIHQLCDLIGIAREKAPITHHLYGNTATSTVPLTMDYLIKNYELLNGDKLVLSSAGGGFSMMSLAGEWRV